MACSITLEVNPLDTTSFDLIPDADSFFHYFWRCVDKSLQSPPLILASISLCASNDRNGTNLLRFLRIISFCITNTLLFGLATFGVTCSFQVRLRNLNRILKLLFMVKILQARLNDLIAVRSFFSNPKRQTS